MHVLICILMQSHQAIASLMDLIIVLSARQQPVTAKAHHNPFAIRGRHQSVAHASPNARIIGHDRQIVKVFAAPRTSTLGVFALCARKVNVLRVSCVRSRMMTTDRVYSN